MRKIACLITILIMWLPGLVLSQKAEHFAGTITFIRLPFPQPYTVERIDLASGKRQELIRANPERPVIQAFRYSSDGQRFVVVMGSIENERANTEIYMGDDTGGKLRRLTHNNIYDGYPAWSLDGKHIVFMRGIRGSDRFRLLDLESQQEQQVREPGLQIHRWANWLPDSQRLIVVAKAHLGGRNEKEVSGLAELNLYKGTARWLYKCDFYILTPRFSPDGRSLVCIVQPRQPLYTKSGEPERINRVHVLDLNSERMQPVGYGPGVFERDLWPVWSPDGKWLAWIRSNGKDRISKVLIHNLETENSRQIMLPEEGADGYSLVWSPDGKHLASVTHQQRQNYTLRLLTLKSGKSTDVLNSKSQIQCLYWR